MSFIGQMLGATAAARGPGGLDAVMHAADESGTSGFGEAGPPEEPPEQPGSGEQTGEGGPPPEAQAPEPPPEAQAPEPPPEARPPEAQPPEPPPAVPSAGGGGPPLPQFIGAGGGTRVLGGSGGVANFGGQLGSGTFIRGGGGFGGGFVGGGGGGFVGGGGGGFVGGGGGGGGGAGGGGQGGGGTPDQPGPPALPAASAVPSTVFVEVGAAAEQAAISRNGVPVPIVSLNETTLGNALGGIGVLPARVVSQSIAPGTSVAKGTSVDLTLTEPSRLLVGVLQNPFTPIATQTLDQVYTSVVKNDLGLQAVLARNQSAATLSAADQATLTQAVTNAGQQITSTPGQTIDAAFDTLQAALTFGS